MPARDNFALRKSMQQKGFCNDSLITRLNGISERKDYHADDDCVSVPDHNTSTMNQDLIQKSGKNTFQIEYMI